MKDDMISRQAAIETVRKAQSIGQAHRMLLQLPSAQLAQDLTNGCTDTISRVAAISICDNAIDLWNGQLGTGALVAVRDAIMALPSSQPGWIPTSERLPDNDRAVLVTLKWAEDDYEVAVGEYWHNSTASHGWGSFEGHVIAWHELPTPYREGRQDD